MNSLRNAKSAIGTVCNLGSKLFAGSRNPVREAKHYHQLKQQCVSVNSTSRGSWYSSKFSSFQEFGKQHSFFKGASRFYQNQIIPPDRRKIWKRVLVIGGVVVVTLWRLERIPYSNRFHLILMSRDRERKIGEEGFNKVMETYEGRILPETHPQSVRLRLITREIVEALQRGLRYEKIGTGLGYENDEQRGQESRYKGSKVATYHLEGLKWEIIIVDRPIVNAFCMPGGKIVVYRGLLDLFETDAEIAAIIAHEVGHIVARHRAESMSNPILSFILGIVVILVPKLSDDAYRFLNLPFAHRREKEADYIGLLLLASAGYNPRVAPHVYKMLGLYDELVDGGSSSDDYLYTHPSGRERAQLLSQDKVMEEALTIYNRSRSGILLRC